jgi:hypothetical protein
LLLIFTEQARVAIMMLPRTEEVSGSNLGQITGHSDLRLRGFRQSLQAHTGTETLNGLRPLPSVFTKLSFHLHPSTGRYVPATERVLT